MTRASLLMITSRGPERNSSVLCQSKLKQTRSAASAVCRWQFRSVPRVNVRLFRIIVSCRSITARPDVNLHHPPPHAHIAACHDSVRRSLHMDPAR